MLDNCVTNVPLYVHNSLIISISNLFDLYFQQMNGGTNRQDRFIGMKLAYEISHFGGYYQSKISRVVMLSGVGYNPTIQKFLRCWRRWT
jgi:hypothetical protein